MASVPALVMGPPVVGAPWQLLSASPPPDLTDVQQLRLQAIMVSLADWANSGEAPIMALLPLGDASAPALLLRAAAGLANSLPQAHAMIVPPDLLAALDGHAERLLPLLPAPDGSRSFGRSPVSIPAQLPALPLRSGWEDIGVAWRNRMVIVPETADVLPTLATLLAIAGPPEQRRRITGWATTALLPPAGDFDPWEACQLLVLGPGRRQPYGAPYLPAQFNALNEPQPVCESPPAWRAWAAFREATAGAPLLPWQPDMAAESVPTLLARLADHGDGARGNRITLVRALLAGRGRQALDLKAAGMHLLAGWLEQDGAADLADDDCANLGRATLLAALASLDRPALALARMQPDRVLWLIDGLCDHPAAAGPTGSAAAVWLARHRPAHAALPAIIAARLAGAPGTDLARMATPAVLRALGPHHADLALQLTAAGLRQPAGNLAAIATSLAALRLGAAR